MPRARPRAPATSSARSSSWSAGRRRCAASIWGGSRCRTSPRAPTCSCGSGAPRRGAAPRGGGGVVADRLDAPKLRATAEPDQGIVALALGEYGRAAELLARALRDGASVSRPLARLARAEALIRGGRCEEAEEELRATALEPLGPGDFPETLVPRLTRLQGLVAAARGDTALAVRRLEEAAGGWRRLLDRTEDGERYTGSFADL